MNKLLKSLWDNYYDPLPAIKQRQEIEDCHKKLVEVLDKQERRLVLQIIDLKDQIAEDLSIDSFMSGFQLAWKLANELNHREKTSPTLARKAVRLDSFCISNEKGELP